MYRSARFTSVDTTKLKPGAGIYPKTLKDATKKFNKPTNVIDSRFEVRASLGDISIKQSLYTLISGW